MNVLERSLLKYRNDVRSFLWDVEEFTFLIIQLGAVIIIQHWNIKIHIKHGQENLCVSIVMPTLCYDKWEYE